LEGINNPTKLLSWVDATTRLAILPIEEKRRVLLAELSAAKKEWKGMAVKIFTGTKPFQKAYFVPFGIIEIEILSFKFDLIYDPPYSEMSIFLF
jgi:hypothetical protein